MVTTCCQLLSVLSHVVNMLSIVVLPTCCQCAITCCQCAVNALSTCCQSCLWGPFRHYHGMSACKINVTPMTCLLSQHRVQFFPLCDLVGPHADRSKCPRHVVNEHAVNELSCCQHVVTAVMLSTGCHLLSPAVSVLSTCCCHLLSLCCQRAVMATSTVVRGALAHAAALLAARCSSSFGAGCAAP
jgi:hypothetical protein